MDGHDMGMMNPSSSIPHKQSMMMMHMSFYWSDQAEFLFSGWPGGSKGKYILSLFIVFILTVLIEWLSRSSILGRRGDNNNVVSRVLRTVLHALRVGLAYLVMLAVMSYNVGVFIVVVLGHALGYLVFGSGLDRNGEHGRDRNHMDLGTTTC